MRKLLKKIQKHVISLYAVGSLAFGAVATDKLQAQSFDFDDYSNIPTIPSPSSLSTQNFSNNLNSLEWQYRNNYGTIIGIHGINQSWANWSNLEHELELRGHNVIGIDLPNLGHEGWEVNKQIIDNTLKEIDGPVVGLFGYSLAGPTWIRYVEENPDFIAQNPNVKMVLVDPAVSSELGQFLTSESLRPIVGTLAGHYTLTPTENELTGRDAGHFLEQTYNDLGKLQSMKDYNWEINVVRLNSLVVDGDRIDNWFSDTMRGGYGINTKVHTIDNVMNEFGPTPSPGNQGNFPGGNYNDLTTRTIIPEYTRDKAPHASWGNDMRGSINSFSSYHLTSPMPREQIISNTLDYHEQRQQAINNALDYHEQIINSSRPQFYPPQQTITPQPTSSGLSMGHEEFYKELIKSSNQSGLRFTPPTYTNPGLSNGFLGFYQFKTTPIQPTQPNFRLTPSTNYNFNNFNSGFNNFNNFGWPP